MFLLFIFCFCFLDYFLFFLIMSIRGEAMVVVLLLLLEYLLFYGHCEFCFWLCCFLSLVPRKSEPNLGFTFCIRQHFQYAFLGLTLTLAFVSIFTGKSMDLESDHLDSSPNLTHSCSSTGAASLASLNLSFSSVTNEDCNNTLPS